MIESNHTNCGDSTNPKCATAETTEIPLSAALEVEMFLARKRINNRFVRGLLICLGCIAVGLGLLGIPLPVLPTTPFLLLAAWCFGRSSERLLKWLLTNRIFGDYLRNYVHNRGIPKRAKVYILITLWATISFSAFWVVNSWWLRLLLITIAIGVTVHILRIRTSKTI